MNGFRDVIVSWAGRDYTIPASRLMPVIAEIEGILVDATGQSAVQTLLEAARPALLAQAFEVLLKRAGADVQPGEVYLSVMNGFAARDASLIQRVQQQQLALLEVLAPPVHSALFADKSPESEAGKKQDPASA